MLLVSRLPRSSFSPSSFALTCLCPSPSLLENSTHLARLAKRRRRKTLYPTASPVKKAGRVVRLPGDHLVRVPILLWLFIPRPFGLQVNLFVFRLEAL
ncbi:hypothetical protein HZ326_17573 [Fusarium oxysporum f. sp. albedinis]|jgi:hypothetical protein|nr:hypothetical protein HZ326_17573 [Fusarium oxysporum f. sp. albedinis]